MIDKNLSKEERAILLEKARVSREEKLKYAEENLQMSYGEDDDHWTKLAKKHGIRLPQKHIPASETKYLKKALKKLGVTPKEWLEEEGLTTLKQFAILNPTWTARAHVGLLLEYVEGK